MFHQQGRHLRRALVVAEVAMCLGAIASYAASPEQQCQSGKNKAAGKYAACRQTAEAKLVSTGDTAVYTAAITKCEGKFTGAWTKLEASAAGKGGACLDGAPTDPEFKTVIDGHSGNIRTALGGGGLVRCGNAIKDGVEACDGSDLGGKSCVSFGFASGTLSCDPGCGLNITGCQPIVCGNGTLDAGEQCDQGNLNGQTCASLGFVFGTLTCSAGCLLNTSGCHAPPRLVDNGDGTITDQQTGLMWEKKAALDNVAVKCSSAATCPNPHDADNQYTWTDNTTPTVFPTGTAFTVFLPQLNAGSGFAGHTDWRLPTLEELQGLVDYTDASSPIVNAVFDTGCTSSCTVTTCSCTTPGLHWMSTSVAANPGNAWILNLGDGGLTTDTKDTDYFVRAVRP